MQRGFLLMMMLTVFSLIIPSPHAAAESHYVSIKLVNYVGSPSELSIQVKGDYVTSGGTLIPSGSSVKVRVDNGQLSWNENTNQGTSVTFTPKTYNRDHYITIKDRSYLGEMTFTVENGNRVRPTNRLLLEDYVLGVVPQEMPVAWNLEALKAQAVLARTYVMGKLDQTIDDTVRYQVFGGLSTNSNVRKAVEETEGQVLKFNGKWVEAVYSSSNGGMLESNHHIWNSPPLAYLSAKPDPYDPKIQWNLDLHKVQIDLTDKDLTQPDSWWGAATEVNGEMAQSIKAWLMQNGYAGKEIKIVSIPHLSISEERTSGERRTRGSMAVDFMVRENGAVLPVSVFYEDIPISSIRNMIGTRFLRSTFIDSLTDNGTVFQFAGRGYGHGVGMSQYGAKSMADQGHSYRDILGFYFPGTELVGKKVVQDKPVPEEPVKEEPVKEEPKNPLPSRSDYTAQPVIRVVVNNEVQTYDIAPYIEEGRTMVPLRGIFEALGSDVVWDQRTKTVTAFKGATIVQLQIGSKVAQVNSKKVSLDAPARNKNGRTMVPLRFISEALGAIVEWDAQSRTVFVDL
ncbi:SpoIID/LytB domain-containing protein [Ammoniphilus sp. YIM 78166]|uniref:SpoIID/LytB domain-containing protein n=1 Tax=Ammoniphilus sp. YIM 78166 TaxID=1644106 RepID=UPI0014304BA1|nr:SpoIID/LytB domain-containing protein [Ammoniphilus sp. YIM 78166]